MDSIYRDLVPDNLAKRLKILGSHTTHYGSKESVIKFNGGPVINIAGDNLSHHDVADFISRCFKDHDIL